MLSFGQLEKHVKGFSNHRRIQMMDLLTKEPGLSLLDIAEKLKINFKTAGDHTRRLHHAGLITKKHRSAAIAHGLSPRGKIVLKFLRTLE